MQKGIDTNDAYHKVYKLRVAQGYNTKRSYEVTFPFQVIEKEANRNKLSVEEFVQQFKAVACFNGFEGVIYKFVKIDDLEKLNGEAEQ